MWITIAHLRSIVIICVGDWGVAACRVQVNI
jgi:hypothetical protein